MRREKAGPPYWLCLFCLFPSVIINSQIIFLLKVSRCISQNLSWRCLPNQVLVIAPWWLRSWPDRFGLIGFTPFHIYLYANLWQIFLIVSAITNVPSDIVLELLKTSLGNFLAHHLGACGRPRLTPSKLSSIIIMVPHWGHLTFVSLDVPVHPKKQIVKITNDNRILSHFRIPCTFFSI